MREGIILDFKVPHSPSLTSQPSRTASRPSPSPYQFQFQFQFQFPVPCSDALTLGALLTTCPGARANHPWLRPHHLQRRLAKLGADDITPATLAAVSIPLMVPSACPLPARVKLRAVNGPSRWSRAEFLEQQSPASWALGEG
ncbi:hypothetical protein BO71DRAFT_395282 [Aspergillus ellipticus CBS 707.79]|uniref:Uncharacterized protein n=1 Tax=Aspergillus ellipticus CBS 707.79 TaxID=1448320 RepID=A0A319F1J2_9EURO|nr:hypothetical protein BO71DRAFT_395282 [Aspergillus ellipticus CBS 707.79]